MNPETEIAKRSLALFGLTGHMRKISSSLDCSYRVKTEEGRVFALRVSKGISIRRVSAFRVEAEWIDALYGNPWVDVPRVCRTEEGELIGQTPDSAGELRASTLLSWLPGARFPNRITVKRARLVGRMTAAMHQSTQSIEKPSEDTIKTWHAHFMCGMRLKDSLHSFPTDIVELVEGIYHRLVPIYESLEPHETGLINADVGLHNILFHKGRVSMVDFNDSGIGPYAFCLGRLMERIRRHDRGTALADALLNGYRDVIPLPAAYERWGTLFEAVPVLFGLQFSKQRIAERGTALTDREQLAIAHLRDKFKII